MLFSYFNKYFKVIGAVATLVGIIAAWIGVKTHYEKVGYERAINEIQTKANQEIIKATQEAISAAQIEMQEALDKQQLIHDEELKRINSVEQVKVNTVEVIKYVDKIQVKRECTNIDPEFIRLLNESISSVNSTFH